MVVGGSNGHHGWDQVHGCGSGGNGSDGGHGGNAWSFKDCYIKSPPVYEYAKAGHGGNGGDGGRGGNAYVFNVANGVAGKGAQGGAGGYVQANARKGSRGRHGSAGKVIKIEV